MLLQDDRSNTPMLPYLQYLLDNRNFRDFLIEKESLGKRKKTWNETIFFCGTTLKGFSDSFEIERVIGEFGIVPDSDKANFEFKWCWWRIQLLK